MGNHFSDDQKREILAEWDKAPKGSRAETVGARWDISPATLNQYSSRWRRELTSTKDCRREGCPSYAVDAPGYCSWDCNNRARRKRVPNTSRTTLAVFVGKMLEELGSYRAVAAELVANETTVRCWAHGARMRSSTYQDLVGRRPDVPMYTYGPAELREQSRGYADKPSFALGREEVQIASALGHEGKRYKVADDKGRRKRQTPKAVEFQKKNAGNWAEAKGLGHTPAVRLRAWLTRRCRWRDLAVASGYEQVLRELGKRGMSVAGLAGELAITDKHLSAVLTGRVPLSPDLRTHIAKYLALAEAALPEPVTGRGHRHWGERDWAKTTAPTSAEIKVWEKECSDAMDCSVKDVHKEWLPKLRDRGVSLIGPPLLLTEPERKAAVAKALPILRRARELKPDGHLQRGAMANVSQALYGTKTAGDVDRAWHWCAKQAELAHLL